MYDLISNNITNYSSFTNLHEFMMAMSYHNNIDSVFNEETTEHFAMDILDVDSFIKVNDCKEITDPIFFIRDNIPNPNGLLSNEIFGITRDDRANIYAYIDLHEWFLHPLVYKIWTRMDSNIKACVHELKKFKLDDKGYLIEDENGKTGIKFLKANIKNIKIKHTDSRKRDNKIQFIENNRDKLFINKLLVIPAFYRDVNTSKNSSVSVGEINKLYQSVLISARSIQDTVDYGYDLSGSMKGRLQETLVSIYDWFSGNTNNSIDDGNGISKKRGIMQRAVLSKTTDYSSRLVLSAPNLKVETLDEILDTEHAMIPLASLLTNFYPFVMFHIRRIFEDLFADGFLPVVGKDNTIHINELKDPLAEFNDERISKEIKRYIYGYSNRYIPVTVTVANGDVVKLKFKGKRRMNLDGKVSRSDTLIDDRRQSDSPDEVIISRPLTWLDVFFQATSKAVEGKHVLITRYPMDSAYNQVPQKIIISSTIKTQPIVLNGILYKNYPVITKDDIGTDTSNKFIDTCILNNATVDAMGGDYDGDTVSIRGVFTEESNQELEKFIKSKAFYIDLGGNNKKGSHHQCIDAIYSLTKVIDGTKLTEPKFN